MCSLMLILFIESIVSENTLFVFKCTSSESSVSRRNRPRGGVKLQAGTGSRRTRSAFNHIRFSAAFCVFVKFFD